MRPDELVVTGIGVSTPWTDDPAELALERAPRPAVDDSWFEVATQLGPRGFKYLPPACRYLLATARRALGPHEPALADVPGEGRGVVVGSVSAAAKLHADLDATVIASDASQLSPASAPFFSINVCASRLSTAHDCRGFNLTLTTPASAGLEAIGLAGRAVALGRADVVLAGAAEGELPADDPHAGSHYSGAALLVMERAGAAARRGARVHGRCTVRTLFGPPDKQVVAGRVAIAAERLLGATIPVATHAVVDDSPVGSGICAAIGPATVCHTSGAGALLPVLKVAALLARGAGTHLVVAGCGMGNVALARVDCAPGTEQEAARPTRPYGGRE